MAQVLEFGLQVDFDLIERFDRFLSWWSQPEVSRKRRSCEGYFGEWGGPMSTVSAVAMIGREFFDVLLG